MTMHRDKGEIVFECDSCRDAYWPRGTFEQAWEWAKAEGWKARKTEDDEWEHRCPNCEW